MTLDAMAQEIVNETMTALQTAPFKRNVEVLVTPRTMRALILFSQQRMLLQFGGKQITLIEDSDAPDISAAIEAALSAPLPELPEPVLPELRSPTPPSAQLRKQNGGKRR